MLEFSIVIIIVSGTKCRAKGKQLSAILKIWLEQAASLMEHYKVKYPPPLIQISISTKLETLNYQKKGPFKA
jgi:hypothetical protein